MCIYICIYIYIYMYTFMYRERERERIEQRWATPDCISSTAPVNKKTHKRNRHIQYAQSSY